jgi:replicative DNA helicase
MEDKYVVTDEDFSNEFHRVVYGAIYKIHELGAKVITLQNINDFLSSKPKSQGIY